MSGRSLESRLSGKHGNATLTPLQRAAIACGVARGLAALCVPASCLSQPACAAACAADDDDSS